MVVELITTISAALGLVNSLIRIFRSVSKWLKRLANTQWKEDDRYIKIVQSYFARKKTGIVEPHIEYAINHLKQRKIVWLENPAARQAETEAQAIAYYDQPGYTTDLEDSDAEENSDEASSDSEANSGEASSDSEANSDEASLDGEENSDRENQDDSDSDDGKQLDEDISDEDEDSDKYSDEDADLSD